MTLSSSQPTQLSQFPCLSAPIMGLRRSDKYFIKFAAFPLWIQILPVCSHGKSFGPLPPLGCSRDRILFLLPTHSPNDLQQAALRDSSRDKRERPTARRRIWDGKIIEVIRENDSHGPITKVLFGFDIAGIGEKSGWVGLLAQSSYELIRLW